MRMIDERVLWRAVTTRDPGWDGAFVYAVTSTGVYCRPTCPSRRPGRDRVRFFSGADAASAEGFRACRRCHPDSNRAAAPVDRVRRVCEAIAAQQGSRLSTASLARMAGIGTHQLVRSFRQALGVTPREYADACRTGCLKRALRDGHGVADAVYASGFGSSSRVYERSAKTLGMTPARYAAAGAGERITYATGKSSLGTVVVARTLRGICSVALGGSAEELIGRLRREFSGATITPGDGELSEVLERIVGSIDGTAPDPRLPLDVRATAFQQRVWRELQRIPRGATRTYQQIARDIGCPTAARAVARACASNPVAIVVPCHRVVRGDGATGGYRWGAQRKARLLATERHGARLDPDRERLERKGRGQAGSRR